MLVALSLAAFLADRAKPIGRLDTPLKTIVLAAGPIALVFLQPDAGTALVYISVLAAVLFVSGVRWLHLALIGGVGAGRRPGRALVAARRRRERAQAVPDGRA